MITFSSYSLSQTLAQGTPSVLSDDDERDGDDSDDELDDKDEDESEDEEATEDEDENEDEDDIDDMYEDIEDEFEDYLESQKDLQEESIEQLEKLSERSGVVGFLIGPDAESLRKLQEIVDANTRMLQQLQELKQQPLTETEQQALGSLAGSIENQNQVISEEIKEQESSFSLFGWLVKLLSN